MALARVVSFDGVSSDRVAEMRREMEGNEQPEGLNAPEIVVLHDADGSRSVVHAEPATAARLDRVNLVAAVSFMIGGSLFSLGALFAQLDVGTPRSIDTTVAVIPLSANIFCAATANCSSDPVPISTTSGSSSGAPPST